MQGRRKQSLDGQAQLDVGGEDVKNSRAKRAANIWLVIFSSEEPLSIIALKLQTGILRPESLVILNVSLMRAHLGTYPAEFYDSNSRLHKCRTCNYVSTSAENGPAMAGPAGPVPAPIPWLVSLGQVDSWLAIALDSQSWQARLLVSHSLG